ncbi:hypothetical protein Tsubulata_036350 [Turnera subulata]|uniref:Cytochrome P450 n=1 Tax=Turnera subulata TaxID=218843 RepID=A0A9Q0JQA3_9ROSI|nr:hypothetical protein Tsubulata_036350 [Turnera subulata]
MAILFLYLLLFLVLHTITKHFLNKIQNHPPTPFPSLPIIGHLYLLKGPFHRAFTKISERYGPIVLLQFGSLRVLLVSSPKIAEECLGKNDIVFANRPHLFYAKYISDNYTSVVWASYGDHWRNLRKIASLEILSTHRVQMLSNIRQEEIKSLTLYLFQNQNKKLNMKTTFFELTLNVMMRMIAGKRYYGDSVTNVEEAERFREIYGELRRVSKEFFIRDLFPWIGSKETEKKLIQYQRKRDEWIQSLIEEQRQNRNGDLPGERKRNLIQVLLSLQETDPEYYQDKLIRNLVLLLTLKINLGSKPRRQGSCSLAGRDLFLRFSVQKTYSLADKGVVLRSSVQRTCSPSGKGLVLRPNVQRTSSPAGKGLVLRSSLQRTCSPVGNGLVLRSNMQRTCSPLETVLR